MRPRVLGTALAALVALVAALLAAPTSPPASAAGPSLGAPTDLRTTVVAGQKAIRVTWSPPSSGVPAGLAYEVLLDGEVVDTSILETTYTITDPGLVVGHTYDVGVRATVVASHSATVSTAQQLYIAPVTTVQSANPSNPLAGREWGVYTGLQDQAVIGWRAAGYPDKLAPIAMIHKAKFFGNWIPDAQVYQQTKDYIEGAQAGDPERLTILTLFRMFPWEGKASILQRLPTPAEQASYKSYVTNVARAIGDNRVAVVLQPDGFFAWKAYHTLKPKVGRKQALLPARMLAWTSKTLDAAGPNVSVYVDMGSEDWALGKVAPVAKFLKLCGVEYARGFSLDVSHKNYLDREILFAQKVSQALAAMGLKNKHAVIDTSDNGQPFAGKEINPPGSHQPYTPPGEIDPCTKKNQGTPCTALGVPPTTDVDNPAWDLGAEVNKAAARYVDAYLWVSRPWLPDQGQGGTKFSPDFASRLLKTWTFSPYEPFTAKGT
ncbi:glycoside hydrolase family 6 protein [Nocardioides aquiterrae]|uniref:Glucanase n=1 Tax=Nocardioides aquiterrae TaxID=203799 RepID=A0ABN1UFY0_9ACTN